MQAAERVTAAVIGGGLSGLVCGRRLHRAGIDVVCLEASDRVGGALRTVRRDGFTVEGGANTVQETPVLAELVRDLDYESHVVRTPPKLARFIYRHGVLHRLPQTIASMFSTKVVSPAGKLRILGELAIPRRADEVEESIAEFITRRFGAEALEALVAPLVSGTFAGDAGNLGAAAAFPRLVNLERETGSVLRGMLAGGGADAERRASGGLVSFRDGLESLAERIAQDLGERLRRDTRVTRVTKTESGYELTTAESVMTAKSLVVAVPAWTAAELLASIAPEASAALGEIVAPPLVCVSLAWPRSRIEHALDGLGLLVAPGERLRILGCLWPSSMFEGRVPEGDALFTSFVGGARDPQGAWLDDDALVEAVAADLRNVLGAEGEPRVLSIDRYQRAIPQYTVGHRARVERIRAGIAPASGVFLAGNYLDGISVSDCVRQANLTSEAVEKHLETAVDFSRPGV